MTKYDFDKIIDRRNTDCLKYDFAIQRGRPADVLPFLGSRYGFSYCPGNTGSTC